MNLWQRLRGVFSAIGEWFRSRGVDVELAALALSQAEAYANDGKLDDVERGERREQIITTIVRATNGRFSRELVGRALDLAVRRIRDRRNQG